MKKHLLLLLALSALPAAAQRPYTLGSDGPGGVCYFDGQAWHCVPQSVPEPASPAVLLTIAGAFLVNQRRRTYAR